MSFRERSLRWFWSEHHRCDHCELMFHYEDGVAWRNDAGEVEGYVCDKCRGYV